MLALLVTGWQSVPGASSRILSHLTVLHLGRQLWTGL
jgi:hypothetical protein